VADRVGIAGVLPEGGNEELRRPHMATTGAGPLRP
jgi:hypothetical protein